MGSTAEAIRLSRLRSSLERIFCEMDILFEKGISTTLRPASEMSDVRRGPLVDMASLAICARMGWPLAMKPEILPVLPIALSRRMF